MGIDTAKHDRTDVTEVYSCASKISEDDVLYKALRVWLISRIGIACPECGILKEE